MANLDFDEAVFEADEVDVDDLNDVRAGESGRARTPRVGDEDVAAIRRRAANLEGGGRRILNLDLPGLPPVGEDFLLFAEKVASDAGGDSSVRRTLAWLIGEALFSSTFAMPVLADTPKWSLVRFVPGGLWRGPIGPCRADVMVVGKMPSVEDQAQGSCFVGVAGGFLFETASRFFPKNFDFSRVYVSNALRHGPPNPRKPDDLPQRLFRNCAHLLWQEIGLVRPRFILCVGADALRAVCKDRNASLAQWEGMVFDVAVPGRKRTAQAMAVLHPAHVLRQPELEPDFESGISRFGRLVSGAGVFEDESRRDYRIVCTESELRDLVQEIRFELKGRKDAILAVDSEWHGRRPGQPGAYLRTVQVAWDEGKAALVRLRSAGGVPGFDAGEEAAIRLLRTLFDGVRVCGHFFNSDLEWLLAAGLDLRPNFRVAESPEKTRFSGGFDTGLAAHAVDETSRFKLELLAVRYTDMRRWDGPMRAWSKERRRSSDLQGGDLEGFGEHPDEILEPYALADVDATYRLYGVFQRLLDCDRFGLSCRRAFHTAMRANPAVFEMSASGMLLDRSRLDALYEVYEKARRRIERTIRRWARWPTLNLNSPDQFRELLFGYAKRDASGFPVRLRPDGAVSMKLTPVVDTSKRPVPWSVVVEQGRESTSTPSTGKASLAILSFEHPNERVRKAVSALKSWRSVVQVLRYFVRPPRMDPETGAPARRPDGFYDFRDGVGGFADEDGYVRTHFLQTTKTGRWRSFQPNLQNCAKRKENEYREILGEDYVFPLRSVFRAPEKSVLVSFDYSGAELFLAAVLSGDEAMTDHVFRGQLSKDDPDYYDIHSAVAVEAYRLDCAPTKEGLRSIGKLHLRDVAKTVAFGILYGRRSKSLAMGCREMGVFVSEEEAEALRCAFFARYPKVLSFLEACQARVLNPGWIRSCKGRLRRFPVVSSDSMRMALEREAANFVIQGGVADVVNETAANLLDYRDEVGDPDLYRLRLQVHDELTLSVPVEKLDRVVDEAIPICARDRVSVVRCDLDGVPVEGALPQRLSFETSVYLNWGEPLTKAQCSSLGISEKYAGSN